MVGRHEATAPKSRIVGVGIGSLAASYHQNQRLSPLDSTVGNEDAKWAPGLAMRDISQEREDASMANVVEIAQCCKRGQAECDKVEDMNRPPDVLDSKRTRRILELPSAALLIEPST